MEAAVQQAPGAREGMTAAAEDSHEQQQQQQQRQQQQNVDEQSLAASKVDCWHMCSCPCKRGLPPLSHVTCTMHVSSTSKLRCYIPWQAQVADADRRAAAAERRVAQLEAMLRRAGALRSRAAAAVCPCNPQTRIERHRHHLYRCWQQVADNTSIGAASSLCACPAHTTHLQAAKACQRG